MAEPPPASQPDVFLSYTSPDRARVLALADRLEATGIRVWVDRRDLVGGSRWDASIVDAISHCTVFILTCSPQSLASPNVQQEVSLAWEEQRPILPLLLDQVTIPRELRYPLAGRQWLELLDRPQDAWLPEVLRALAGLGVGPATPQPTAEPTPALPPVRPPTNLPLSLTSFIGREQELADIVALLGTARLLTLTGPGGTGKTRLALQAAALQAAAFPEGVFFVDLAPLQDPTLVPSAVAQGLSVQGNPDLPLRESVLRFVRDKQLLLVLDNYEHLLTAAEFAGALLQGAPQLSLLVTSRAPLRVPGEREYAVPPLPLPGEMRASVAALVENPAVALFVQRAQDVRADFRLTADNAAAVAAICTQLDGLPLAIELAAARVRALPPAALLARLAQRLPVLTGGARTVPARQQTLRGAISWSYDLLEPAEQRLFRRLGVFAAGCTLGLAEAVCGADGDLGLDVLDGVSSLVEKSLLREGDGLGGEPRYRMLETIREFALGELTASREADGVRRHLAVQMLQLARTGWAARDWMRLDSELDNARAVLGWCVERAELDVGVRLWWDLRWYLFNRGGDKEQEVWRRRLLALPDATQPSSSRARLLAFPARDDLPSITEQDRRAADLVEAVGLSRELGDNAGLAAALQELAFLRLTQGNHDAVVPLAEEALALFLEAGAAGAAVTPRGYLIRVALARGDIAAAEALVAANLGPAGTTRAAISLFSEAQLAEARGNDAQARVLAEEYVRRAGAESGEKSPGRLLALAFLARVMLRQGNTRAAVAVCGESLSVHRAVGASRTLPVLLNVLAQTAARCGLLTDGARLLAAVAVQRREFAAELLGLQEAQQAALERVRAALGEVAFAAAWAAGEALSTDAAIDLGLTVVAELQQGLATDPAAADQDT